MRNANFRLEAPFAAMLLKGWLGWHFAKDGIGLINRQSLSHKQKLPDNALMAVLLI
jgi:hypothetical protein